MPSSTSRLALVLPLGTDAPSEYRLAITANANTLDTAVQITSGTLASRPSAPPIGNEYYATDTAQWFKYTGSAWLLQIPSAAYTDVTLASGLIPLTGHYTPAARIEGDWVKLRGAFQNTSGSSISSGTTLFTLPSGMAPIAAFVDMSISWGSSTTFNPGFLRITSSGVASLLGAPLANSEDVPLDALNFSLV